MTATTQAEVVARGSRPKPLLVVITNLGNLGTPNLLVGDDPSNLTFQGIPIVPGASSPQITVTGLLWIRSVTATQQYNILTQNL